MKKKNLAILLIMPFLIALFGIATIKTAFNLIDNDVIRINWSYRDNELFEVGKQFVLSAEGVVADKRYPASEGNRLIWTVENYDGEDKPHAEVISDGFDTWYLKTISAGKVTITCTTEKKNVTPMSMTGIIHDGDAFVVNTKVGGSGQVVDSTLYYGQYDLDNGQKVPAVIDFELTASSDSLVSGAEVDRDNTTSNISVDLGAGKITINRVIDGRSALTIKNAKYDVETTFEFTVVKDGINVYTYEDLLYCTNRSQDGEIAVLRKHFESKANAESSTASNVAMFGTNKGDGFNFVNEAYTFETTYNSEYIDQWNNPDSWQSGSNIPTNYKKVDKILYAGLRIQKDFYGNGYTLNLHNLCFPTNGFTDPNTGVEYYELGANDLFRGPKPFYLLGDPNNSKPLVTAYGQDNVGFYIDGDNITVNDVKIKNCDFGLIVYNLEYTGTVVEVNGSGNTIKNSVLSNGKNVVRSFSSMGLSLDNCILSTARNFLLMVGSNEYEKNEPNSTMQHDFMQLDGEILRATTFDYLAQGEAGDTILNYFNIGFASLNELLGETQIPAEVKDKAKMKAALHSLQEGLNRSDVITANSVVGSTNVIDTIFYRSGVASIGVDTMFNGPFLYNTSPSMIQMILGLFGGLMDEAVPMFPQNISGSAYPVTVNISGNTKFFDYKSLDEWDISGLIDQNISALVSNLANNFGMNLDLDITIDDIFPLKEILTSVARSNGCIYKAGDTDYINIPIAYYGGGKNLSSVSTTELSSGGLTRTYDVDLLDSYLNLNTTIDFSGILNGDGNLTGGLSGLLSDKNTMRYMKEVLTKTVTSVTGFEAFKFKFINNPDGLFDMETNTPLSPDYRDIQKKA